jgi:hypothetical protein
MAEPSAAEQEPVPEGVTDAEIPSAFRPRCLAGAEGERRALKSQAF